MRWICSVVCLTTTMGVQAGVVNYNYDSRLFHLEGSGDFRSDPFSALPYRYEYSISQVSIGRLDASIAVSFTGDSFSLPGFRVQMTEPESLKNALVYRSASLNPDLPYDMALPTISGRIRPFDGGGFITGELSEGVGQALVLLILDQGNIQGSIPQIAEYNLNSQPVTLIGTLGVSESQVEFTFPLQHGPPLSFSPLSPTVEASNWMAYGRFTNPESVPESSGLLWGASAILVAFLRFLRRNGSPQSSVMPSPLGSKAKHMPGSASSGAA
jgi:hypothetical protein